MEAQIREQHTWSIYSSSFTSAAGVPCICLKEYTYINTHTHTYIHIHVHIEIHTASYTHIHSTQTLHWSYKHGSTLHVSDHISAQTVRRMIQRMCLQPSETYSACSIHTACHGKQTCPTCVVSRQPQALTHRNCSDVRPWNTPTGSVVI